MSTSSPDPRADDLKRRAYEAADAMEQVKQQGNSIASAPSIPRPPSVTPRCKNCRHWLKNIPSISPSTRKKHVCAFLKPDYTGGLMTYEDRKGEHTGKRTRPNFSCGNFHVRHRPYYNPERHSPDRYAIRRIERKERWRQYGLNVHATAGAAHEELGGD